MLKTYKIIINGQVQGVGFRPFVFVLAQRLGLKGYVSNNEEGVIIYVNGIQDKIKAFYDQLLNEPPPVSRIKTHFLEEVDKKRFEAFNIIPSTKSSKLNLQLTPDFGICDDCKKEIAEPSNRRYQYPFTTCVNCGPRWAVTNTFPFERMHTSLADFMMCEDCQREYTDPTDRRFHSQTNTCETCGMKLSLETTGGVVLDLSGMSIYKKISSLLKKGKIIAIKNTGGYLLCCDASQTEVIKRLRRLKKRPQKPFAVLYPSLALLEKQLDLSEQQRIDLCDPERPIVIVSSENFKGKLALEELAPKLNQLGVMLPYSGILQLLSNELEQPIVATSGNIHGSPILSHSATAKELISGIADFFVHHNMPILNAQDDSVVKYSFNTEQKVMFRRSRGYAPNYFDFKWSGKERILALGSHLKSTIAFIPNDFLYISQYLGNLDHYDVYQRFIETTENLINIFEQPPQTILVDNHPAYLSTQYGKELSQKFQAPMFEIQHHKAHFAAVLGEHELFDSKETVLGVIWDGTGYGDDGEIWGGEFFIYSQREMERLTHFEYFDWLAGDKMAKEPRLSFLSLSQDTGIKHLAQKFSKNELKIYTLLKEKNRLQTSSVGRLFDAVASLLGFCDFNTYEGEAAILLENSLLGYDLKKCISYLSISDDNTIDTRVLFNKLCEEVIDSVDKASVIRNFLFTLASIVLETAKNQKIKKIAFSGGVFQNTVLIDMLKEMSGNHFELYFNRNLAPNDENISYGQLMYYTQIITKM